ncbi:MAG: hypothetical protein JW819_00660 [Candidatus Krumholzibacteriota bacterium]|nr:hypothetical protein [Candidatus Krumholzibacteriota bacterium]
MKRSRTIYLAMILVLALPAASAAYTVLLDIDIDDDPTTLNESTPLSAATIMLVLAPDYPNETITLVEFALGGACLNCYDFNYGWNYGVVFNILWGDWITDPRFESSIHDGILYAGCMGNPSAHEIFSATAADEGFQLSGPTFIHAFPAQVNENIDTEFCPVPERTLTTFNNIWEEWVEGNTVVLDFTTATRDGNWSVVKSLY